MPMQIRGTAIVDNPPTGLAERQLSVEMAGPQPKLWVGVPTSIDPSGRRLLAPSEVISSDIIPYGGRLDIVGSSPSSTIGFKPFNGSWIRLNGQDYLVPSQGISSIVTNAFLDGVQTSLPVESFYYVYVFLETISNSLHLDFSLTGHTPSNNAGNLGTETKAGDDSRSFVGIMRLETGNLVHNSSFRCGIRSWFNRQRAVLNSATLVWSAPGMGPTKSGGMFFTAFEGEVPFLVATGNQTAANAGSGIAFGLYIGAAMSAFTTSTWDSIAPNQRSIVAASSAAFTPPTDGFYYISMGTIPGGAGNVDTAASLAISMG